MFDSNWQKQTNKHTTSIYKFQNKLFDVKRALDLKVFLVQNCTTNLLVFNELNRWRSMKIICLSVCLSECFLHSYSPSVLHLLIRFLTFFSLNKMLNYLLLLFLILIGKTFILFLSFWNWAYMRVCVLCFCVSVSVKSFLCYVLCCFNFYKEPSLIIGMKPSLTNSTIQRNESKLAQSIKN